MKKLLLALTILILSAVPNFAMAQGLDVKPETTLLLPLAEGMATRWVLPPAGPEFIKRYNDMRVSLSIDNDGHAWLGFADATVLCPQKNYSFKLPETFWDFVCLDNGAVLFATTSRLALLRVIPAAGTQPASVILQPVAMLPPDCSRMVKGADNCLYFICNDEKTGKNTVWLFKPQSYQGTRGIPEFQKVFVADVPVNAVAGDGVTTWVASGKMIIRIDAQKQLHRQYLHPHHVIVDLAYTKTGGLFYATGFAVGYAGDIGVVEFLNTRGPLIACAGSSMYVMFPDDYGLMAVDGVDRLKNYDLPLAGIKKVSALKHDQ
ncbi:MAG: hypothetical protein CVV41_03460 [Candidatus Riflebacteria bacterium HGW-Riflebacteria-1]|jgi:hypothetical protein|nr:MAG: hypothetical protein CVV41_03460 [Candidatus Riflebacteria bacterium HGW-Riflebacteria-1]